MIFHKGTSALVNWQPNKRPSCRITEVWIALVFFSACLQILTMTNHLLARNNNVDDDVRVVFQSSDQVSAETEETKSAVTRPETSLKKKIAKLKSKLPE